MTQVCFRFSRIKPSKTHPNLMIQTEPAKIRPKPYQTDICINKITSPSIFQIK